MDSGIGNKIICKPAKAVPPLMAKTGNAMTDATNEALRGQFQLTRQQSFTKQKLIPPLYDQAARRASAAATVSSTGVELAFKHLAKAVVTSAFCKQVLPVFSKGVAPNTDPDAAGRMA